MVSSGTTTFNLNVEEIISEAFDLVGGELTSGEDLRKARTALNLLLIDLQNRGHPLAKMARVQVSTTASATNYVLGGYILDVLDVTLSRGGKVTSMERQPILEYHNISNKTQKGRPSQYSLDRGKSAITLYTYPAAENSTDLLDMWVVAKIEDTGAYTNTLDMNTRYLPALVFGLAYFLSMKRDGVPPEKRQELLANYTTLLDNAFTEDTDRSSYQPSPFPYNRR